MTPFSRREGLQLILGAARAVLLLGATGCRPDPFPARDDPHHSCAGVYLDLFERYGPAGGSSSGLRYSIYARSNARRAPAKAILAVRLGANDQDVLRFICNHRTIRTDNSDECHPLVSPSGRLVVFNSNWQEPGVETDNDVHPYIALLPEAWYDPNNSGSQSD